MSPFLKSEVKYDIAGGRVGEKKRRRMRCEENAVSEKKGG